MAREGNRFLKGHNRRGKIHSPESRAKMGAPKKEKGNVVRQLCECGCGELAKEGNRFLKGHTWRGKTRPKETKINIGVALKGKKPWNKGIPCSEETKINIGVALKGRIPSKETRTKMKVAHTYNLKDWQEKYPSLCMVEELIEDLKTGKILAHCTNFNCPNSKRNDGWFYPTGQQLFDRSCQLENGDDTCCFYCSEQCKRTCKKYGKSAAQLQKEDALAAGIRPSTPVLPYTSAELEVFRQEVLKRDNHKCLYCGEPATHVHHMRPQKLEPFFALDPDYAISCCDKCHYKYGHRTGTECSTGVLANTTCTKPILFLEQEYCAVTKEEQHGLPFSKYL